MKISLFTCNLANASKLPVITNSEVFQCDPDIHIEMTQEDYRPLNEGSVFSSSVFPKNLQLLATKSLNRGATTQNIVIRVFSNNNIPYVSGGKEIGAKGKNNWKFKTQKLLAYTGTGLGASKGAVWVKLLLPQPILFVCMHLPMKKNAPGLGLEIRAQAFHRLLKEISPLIDSNTTVFVGGDLNFRMTYEGIDQLTEELVKTPFLKELPFLNEDDKIFTCKFKALNNKKTNNRCITKRLTPVPLNPDPNFVKNLQQQCGDEKRIPSRCDRFLYHLGSGKQIDVNYQKGGPLVFASDHNAMWACLELYDGADSDKVGLNDEEIGSVLNSGNNDRTPANFENNTKIGGHARRRWTRRSSRF